VWSIAQEVAASTSSKASGSGGNSATKRDGDHKLSTVGAVVGVGEAAAAVVDIAPERGVGGVGGLWPLPLAFRATLLCDGQPLLSRLLRLSTLLLLLLTLLLAAEDDEGESDSTGAGIVLDNPFPAPPPLPWLPGASCEGNFAFPRVRIGGEGPSI